VSFIHHQSCHLHIFWTKVSISCNKMKQSLQILCIMCKCTWGRSCLSVCLSVYLSVYLSMYLSIHPSIHPCYKPRTAKQILVTFHMKIMTLQGTPQRCYCNTTTNMRQTHKLEVGAKSAPPMLRSWSDVWQWVFKKYAAFDTFDTETA
jgi:hypothetical protein